uniref:Uncharacterized protein n=1 Tax=Glossina brevipalpis TaxID=37001 RepID=A0A1A9WTI9_9MUSC
MQTGSSGCHYNWLTIMLLICLVFCYNQHATSALDSSTSNTTTNSTATNDTNDISKQELHLHIKEQHATTYIISNAVTHIITATITADTTDATTAATTTTTTTTIANTDLRRYSLYCHYLIRYNDMGCHHDHDHHHHHHHHHSYHLTSNNVNGLRYCCGCYSRCNMIWQRRCHTQWQFDFSCNYCPYINNTECKFVCLR